MIPSLPDISFINNATTKNKSRNESQANLNLNLNSDLPNFSLPTSNFHTNYPDGIYNVDTDNIIQKRKRGRPSNKIAKTSQRKINQSLNNKTVTSFINDLLAGASVHSLSIKYGLSESVGYKLQREFYQRQEYPFRSSRGGARRSKITYDDSEFFCDLIRSNPQISSKEIQEKLKEQKGKDVSTSAINKHLKYNMKDFGLHNFVIKKCVFVENRRNSEEILDKRIKYINIYKECIRNGKDFVFIDETPFNTICFNNKGRAPVGTPCRVFKKFTSFKNITAITAIHRTFGIISTKFVEGPVNQNVFKLFLEELFGIMNFYKIKPVYVMDNVSFHKTKKIIELFNETNNTCLLTAPWSCELNPIEYIFGIWKKRIKIPRNIELSEITNFISQGLLSITKEEVSKTIFFVETIIFNDALHRKNLVLRDNQSCFHKKYLKDGNNESNLLNYDPNLNMEDLNKDMMIDNDYGTILCSFNANMPSQQLNDTEYIQNNNDSNSSLNSPPLQDDSLVYFSECDQNSSDCSSFIDPSELISHSSSGNIRSKKDSADDSFYSFNNYEFFSSSETQGNCIPNPQSNERTNYIQLSSTDNESLGQNSCSSSTSTIKLNENNELSTQNKKNLSDNQVGDLYSIQQMCDHLDHEIETSHSVSSEYCSSKSSGDTVRLDI